MHGVCTLNLFIAANIGSDADGSGLFPFALLRLLCSVAHRCMHMNLPDICINIYINAYEWFWSFIIDLVFYNETF